MSSARPVWNDGAERVKQPFDSGKLTLQNQGFISKIKIVSSVRHKGCAMIHQEKVCDMAKMEIYKEKEGERDLNIRSYRRQDFVALELIKSLISGTVAFAAAAGIYLLYDVNIIAEFDNLEIIFSYAVRVGIIYGVFMAAYLVFTFFHARKRYRSAMKHTSDYMQRLKRVAKTYRKPEN